MRIAVIGAGAIGLLVSSYLAEHQQLVLFTRSMEQAKAISRFGITRKVFGSEQIIPAAAESFSSVQQLADFDLVMIAVKQYHLPALLVELTDFSGRIIFLQNGMAHLNRVQQLVHAQAIYLGIVEHGAVRTGLASVEHTGMGKIKIGCIQGKDDFAFHQLNMPSFPIKVSRNIETTLIEKLVVNAIINPITAVFRVKNGQLLMDSCLQAIADELFSEIIQALQIKQQDHASYYQNFKAICEKTANNSSSMLKDIEAGRLTEVEAILGYICTVAQTNQKPVPLCQAFYHLIQVLEKGRVIESY